MKQKREYKQPVFPRSTEAEMVGFDLSSKVCTMNCGNHKDDPRTEKEHKFQCTDCIVKENRT